jgi:hypothetical protein
MAGQNNLECPLEWFSCYYNIWQVGSKILDWPEKIVRDKHCSLLYLSVSNEEK